jgi:hypothetical protein
MSFPATTTLPSDPLGDESDHSYRACSPMGEDVALPPPLLAPHLFQKPGEARASNVRLAWIPAITPPLIDRFSEPPQKIPILLSFPA